LRCCWALKLRTGLLVERFRSVQSPISTAEVPDGYEALVMVEAVQGPRRLACREAALAQPGGRFLIIGADQRPGSNHPAGEDRSQG
jgi:hypothetical protein